MDLIWIKKKRTNNLMDFALPVENRLKIKENEKIDGYLEFASELKKAVKHEVNRDTDYNWSSWNSFWKTEKEICGTE